MGFSGRISNKLFLLKIILLILFLKWQIYLIFIYKHPTLDVEVYPNTNPSPPIIKGVSLGQTFLAKRNGLAKIEVMMGTYGRENNRDIEFSLWELRPNKKLVRKIIVNARRIRNNLYNEFKFKPISDSQGKMFYFQFSSPDSTKDNAVCCWLNNKNIYSNGQFILNGAQQKADIVFRIYAQRPIIQELRTLVKNNSEIMGNYWALVIGIIFFELIQIVAFIWLLNWLFSFIPSRVLP